MFAKQVFGSLVEENTDSPCLRWCVPPTFRQFSMPTVVKRMSMSKSENRLPGPLRAFHGQSGEGVA